MFRLGVIILVSLLPTMPSKFSKLSSSSIKSSDCSSSSLPSSSTTPNPKPKSVLFRSDDCSSGLYFFYRVFDTDLFDILDRMEPFEALKFDWLFYEWPSLLGS